MNTTITKRFINTFFVLSGVSLILIYLVRFFIFDEAYIIKSGGMLSFLIVGIISYFTFLPYIMALSCYRAYFYHKDNPYDTIKSVTQKTVIATTVIIVFYGLFIVFFSSILLDTMYNLFLANKYKKYFEYEKNAQNILLAEGREAFYKSDFDLANEIAKEALFNNPNDSDVMIFIRDIRNTESKYMSQFATREEQIEEENINIGVKYFVEKDYKKAEASFLRVLSINKENEIAKYYLNQIAVATGSGIDKYKGIGNVGIKVYDRMSLAITYYNDGNYLQAYNIFSDLYSKYPENTEIFNYYRLVLEQIRKTNFFIEDVEKIYEMSIWTNSIAERSIEKINKNFANALVFYDIIEYSDNCQIIKIDNNKYIYTSIRTFFDDIYFFDTVIVDVARNYDNMTYEKYRFGKLVKNPNGGYNIILKAKYSNIGGDISYNVNNEEYNSDIYLDVNMRTLEILKEYNTIKYRPLSDLIILLRDMPKIGYSKSAIMFLFVKKIFSPLIMLLICVIVSYYSFKYRTLGSAHIYHRIVGFLGTIVFAYFITAIFNFILATISVFNMNVLYIIFAAALIAVIFVYSIKFFKIDFNR